MPSTLSSIRESALPRLVDHAAGTPLLWLWGACRRTRVPPAAPRHFGLMMFETIGDTLLAASLIASLRASVPDVRVTVFASRGNLGVLALLAGIDAVVDVPLTRPLHAFAAIRSIAVDVMFDIGQWPRWYALLCAASRSRYTIGFATPGQWRHYAYDRAVPHGRDVHELANFQRLLEPIPGASPLPPERALKPVGRPPAAIGACTPYVVMHPWASGFRFASREWPLARWSELIARTCALGMAVLVSGSPADRPRAAALVARCPGGLPVRSIAGDVSLAELAAVLQAAAAVVAVNTGVMHLAALLDAPLVALHGPTSRRRWGPVGSRSIALAPPPPAACEFLHLGFEYPGRPANCMERIEVDEVLAALRSLLR
ncbi:glycosyltransferase family 9 protein [Ramlibacter sp. RBP-2]|uniref:Glycosyltransferase family 9 protein n=1 Tax=Ramlibacter lithotrophicus TaxID=2606681 RepID=A0A7X6I6P9_9BURK|nr:glycosyltransferase family 9 protein [Ramlibacter lithotrophicus]NKE66623.1 glycosyltransferase family 9 protein [Ramlibacter lithotrophicus]